MLGSLAWILLFCGAVPAIAAALIALPQLRRPAIGLLAFWTCHVKKPFYMEVFFEAYRGVDRGFGVTIADLLFFGLALALLAGADGRRRCWWAFNTAWWGLLVLVSALSLLQSPVAYYGLFSLHKLVRGFVLFWVVVNVLRDGDDLRALLLGLAAALIFQAALVVWAKYVTRAVVNRSVGSFPHPNSLAMYVNLAMPALLALLLSGRLYGRDEPWFALAILGGVICVVFTKSRGSLVLMGGALAGTTVLSLALRPTGRKAAIVAAGLLVALVIGAAAAPKMIKRFQEAPKASEETRHYFNDAALAMAREHPLGTGLNSYSWMLANTDYYWLVYPDKVDVPDPEAFRESKSGLSRLGTCHHIYLLWAAETGWAGAVIFVVFVARFALLAAWLLVVLRDEALRALIIGVLAGLSTLHLQGLLEWVFRQTQVFYLFCLISGLTVAIARIHADQRGAV